VKQRRRQGDLRHYKTAVHNRFSMTALFLKGVLLTYQRSLEMDDFIFTALAFSFSE
jgi:hypothetical protein